jgi:hypothetical protein
LFSNKKKIEQYIHYKFKKRTYELVNQIINWTESNSKYFRPIPDSVLAVPHVDERGADF